MATTKTVVGFYGELAVMVMRHFVSGKRKVVIFVYKSYVDACGTRLAVVAVNAVADTGVKPPMTE